MPASRKGPPADGDSGDDRPRHPGVPAASRVPAAGASPHSGASAVSAPLPTDDPSIFELDLEGLATHWAATAAQSAIGAEAMTGTDRRAQALGFSGVRLMENAGCAVAAVARALAAKTGRLDRGPIVILCGPGNNGGDGFVAARHLSRHGLRTVAVLVAGEGRPTTPDATRNWDRLEVEDHVERIHTPVARDISILGQGIEKASLVVDALLGTGVHGPLRDPIRSAVELIGRARVAGIPILAVDTPTAVDLTSGELSDPVVRAHVTVTFHRPKTGLLTRRGAAMAGRVLVAPIGIPPEADRG
jgi:ADP-dependent NAD(P)H-hydrate dehydratase / NAD(P)H-hydrate epimerase